jgi:hypothetical protein
MNPTLRFVPGRIEGLRDVREVALYADRIEFHRPEGTVQHRLQEIANWPNPRWFWRVMFRLGWGPRWLPVADWDIVDRHRCFRLYTNPPITVFMPPNLDGPQAFMEVAATLRNGGFALFDLT